jgi:hypothetical protein
MTENYIFKNQTLMRLYETVNSKTVANLKCTDHIHSVLYPYIRAVIDDKEAYQEGLLSSWYPFRAISIHANGNKEYERMNPEVSVSFSLYMYIYH